MAQYSVNDKLIINFPSASNSMELSALNLHFVTLELSKLLFDIFHSHYLFQLFSLLYHQTWAQDFIKDFLSCLIFVVDLHPSLPYSKPDP